MSETEETIKPDEVAKPIEVAAEHQQTPSLESADLSALAQQAAAPEGAASASTPAAAATTSSAPKEEDVKLLKPIQDELKKIEEAYVAKRLALELEFEDLRRPVLAKLTEVVSGDADASGSAAASESETKKGIDSFWLTIMKNMKATRVFITKNDEDALKYLRDVRVSVVDPSKGDQKLGYRLEFEFAENPYFTNKVLTKTLEVTRLFAACEFHIGKMHGTAIEWKSEDKNLTLAPAASEGNDKPEPDSFFLFFDVKTADIAYTVDAEGNVQLPEGEYFALQRDYQIAEALRTKAVPDAIKWFTGEYYEEEINADDDDEEEEEEDDEEEEGEKAEEEEAEEEEGGDDE